MTAAQFRLSLGRIGLTQTGAARFFGVSRMTMNRWSRPEYMANGPPVAVIKLVQYMIATKATAEQVDAVVKRSKAPRA